MTHRVATTKNAEHVTRSTFLKARRIKMTKYPEQYAQELAETFKELVRVRREFAAYVERVARGEDDKIYAIKAYRIATQLFLKEAKNIICKEYEKRPKPVE